MYFNEFSVMSTSEIAMFCTSRGSFLLLLQHAGRRTPRGWGRFVEGSHRSLTRYHRQVLSDWRRALGIAVGMLRDVCEERPTLCTGCVVCLVGIAIIAGRGDPSFFFDRDTSAACRRRTAEVEDESQPPSQSERFRLDVPRTLSIGLVSCLLATSS